MRAQSGAGGPCWSWNLWSATVQIESAVTNDLRFTGLVPARAAYPFPDSLAPAPVYPRLPGREPVAANAVHVARWQMHKFTKRLLTFEVQIARKWWIKGAEPAPLASASFMFISQQPFSRQHPQDPAGSLFFPGPSCTTVTLQKRYSGSVLRGVKQMERKPRLSIASLLNLLVTERRTLGFARPECCS